MITLGSNVESLKAQRRLGQATQSMTSVFEHLSSGLRITHASDDAAGLAIASSLNVDSRVFGQGVRNVNDAISTLNIAEGATRELSNIVIRIKELAEQSANGVLTATQRGALDKEAQALRNEYDRIGKSTGFNGLNFFASGSTTIGVQAGYGATLDVTVGSELTRMVPDGTFSALLTQFNAGYRPGSIAASDLNGDGKSDLLIGGVPGAGQVETLLSNGDGTFAYKGLIGGGTPIAGDINGDGIVDVILARNYSNNFQTFLGTGTGTFTARISFDSFGPADVTLLDVTGDGKIDIVASSSATGAAIVLSGNGDGTFSAAVSWSSGLPNASGKLTSSDFNGDGNLDLLFIGNTSSAVSVMYGNGNGSFNAGVTYAATGGGAVGLATGDLNNDGLTDFAVTDQSNSRTSVFLNTGNRKFAAPVDYATSPTPLALSILDVNGDGNLDMIQAVNASATFSINLGNGDGTFRAFTSYGSITGGGALAVGDFNGDGVSDFAFASYGARSFGIMLANCNPTSQLEGFDLRTQRSAKAALTTMTTSLTKISRELAQLGAFTSRLNTAASNLQIGQQHFSAAASQILDVDVAEDSSKLVRTQILQQSVAAILAQANIQPQLALNLITGG